MPPRPKTPLSSWGVLRAGSTNTLAACDEAMYDELIVERRYLWKRAIFVSDPEGIKQVLLEKFDNYPRYPPIRRLFEVELGTGTLASEGETWWRHRRVAAPSIDARAIAPEIPRLIEIAEEKAGELPWLAERGPVDMELWAGRVSLYLWNQVVSGSDPDRLQMVQTYSKVPTKPRFTDFIPKPRWAEKVIGDGRNPVVVALNDELNAMIDARREPGYAGPRDLVYRLNFLRDRKSGHPLPRNEVRDETATLIAGGVASVRALTWIWYLLALHPEVEARMHAEIDRVLGGWPPRPEHLPQLTYTRQVLDETMRLYPPIPGMLRIAKDDDVVCGHRVRKGTIVIVMPWLVHRHRKLWENADYFDPDRFTPENTAKRPRLAYIPFAYGPRICVGASFAITHLLTVVATVARRMRFRLATDGPLTPYGRVSLRPTGGLPMIVEERTPNLAA